MEFILVFTVLIAAGIAWRYIDYSKVDTDLTETKEYFVDGKIKNDLHRNVDRVRRAIHERTAPVAPSAKSRPISAKKRKRSVKK